MATYNGADFLAEQLASIRDQDYLNWSLTVSDDGSDDETLRRVDDFARNVQQVVNVIQGPGRGAAENFLHLLRQAGGQDGDWIAFSDQDDVWLPEKLSVSVDALRDIDGPAMFASAVRNVATDLTPISVSQSPRRCAAFRNAIVQNIAAGNTIVLNAQAAEILCQAAQVTRDIPLHDWWCYALVTGCGGHVRFPPEPTVLYRQHDRNLIGANRGWTAQLRRLKRYLSGEHRSFLRRHIQGVESAGRFLTHENRAVLERMLSFGKGSSVGRMTHWVRAAPYCQKRTSTLILWLAALFGRV